MALRIRSLRFEQGGYHCFLCIMMASELLKCTSIDRYDPSLPVDAPGQGYQVPEDPARIKRLANYFRKESRPVIPSSVVLSSREIVGSYDSETSELVLDEGVSLSIIDGQRRIDALRYAINKKGLRELLDYQVPVVIIDPVTKANEMKIFQTINSTQRGMRTDVVNSILAQIAFKGKGVEISESERWKIIITEVIHILNNDEESPWFDRIVSPGESRYTSHQINYEGSFEHRRIVRATSFITSLRPVYNFLAELGFLKGSVKEEAEEFARILDNFWRAMRNKTPSMFTEANSYVLQKSTGIFALHLVLRDLLNDMFKGRREWTVGNFEIMLEDFPSITSSSFWYVGDKFRPPGEASHFGGMKGFRQLADILLEERNNYRFGSSNP